MTQTLQTQPDAYEAAFDALRGSSAKEPAWLAQRRRDAFAGFRTAGFPTASDENWRFTDLRPITQTRFVEPPETPEATDSGLARLVEAESLEDGPLLVFVNGRPDLRLSRLQSLPAGVRVQTLQQALADDAHALHPHFGAIDSPPADVFSSLNLALTTGGAIIRIGKGARTHRPIHLLNIALPASQPFVTHPRNLIIAEPGSSAVVVERYISLGADATSRDSGGGGGGGGYWTNAVTEILVGENAQVTHYLLEEESAQARNISTLAVRQERDSRFTSHTALFGGQLVRNNVYVALRGSGCWSLVNGLFIGRDSQTLDNHMRVVHGKPHGDSRQFYKGILGGKSRGVFTGRILVEPGAQKTDAKQTNRNLLLSDEARIDTQPQLEIYADDVKCTHGATTGRLDPDAMFYLRSRGLDEPAARALLIYAFAHESLDRMEDPAVRAHLAGLLLEKLPHGHAVAQTLAGLPEHEPTATKGETP